ncbi:MAG: hypothetical protein COS34_05525 [Lysobacterales bacterium CG02_land_8_20_14_3_00_62_12]|nr:MAG: hypothetical protein COS34_05525 [Xanthomonadales bacterium CG02_land_8_20_14_3_00_62_12]
MLPLEQPERFMLRRVRQLIDHVDDGMVALVAARRRLVATAATLKRSVGLPLYDHTRESDVALRAQRLGRHLGLESATTDRLFGLLFADAHRVQAPGLDLVAELRADGAPAHRYENGSSNQSRSRLCTNADLVPVALPAAARRPIFPEQIMPSSTRLSFTLAQQLLRLIPPPQRLAVPLSALPERWQRRGFELAVRHLLAGPLAAGALDFLRDRRLGIEVSDLGLRWVVSVQADQLLLCASDLEAEATVRGTATDLLLLASRLEDADTLFFQRRLMMTGDTELGLTARNLLDQLPWESVPLGVRIVLNRGARLARAARAAHRGESADPAALS